MCGCGDGWGEKKNNLRHRRFPQDLNHRLCVKPGATRNEPKTRQTGSTERENLTTALCLFQIRGAQTANDRSAKASVSFSGCSPKGSISMREAAVPAKPFCKSSWVCCQAGPAAMGEDSDACRGNTRHLTSPFAQVLLS